MFHKTVDIWRWISIICIPYGNGNAKSICVFKRCGLCRNGLKCWMPRWVYQPILARSVYILLFLFVIIFFSNIYVGVGVLTGVSEFFERVTTSAHDISQLKVPLYADPRRAAELSCHFKMDEQKLHSVKWYRDTNEIFRYNPTQQPSIRLFNISDVMVQGGECQPDYCVVRVMPPPISTRAAYTCEVSTEGPRFQIARKTKHMTVVAMPQADPVIIGAPKVLKPGEQVFLNCTSDFSLPPSDINWYIDEELQKPEPWQKTEVTGNQPGGLRRSWRVMRVRVPTTASGSLRVRCESILLVEPPVVRDANTIITIHSRTQLSKYVSNISGTNVVNTGLLIATIVLWTLIKISRLTSL